MNANMKVNVEFRYYNEDYYQGCKLLLAKKVLMRLYNLKLKSKSKFG